MDDYSERERKIKTVNDITDKRIVKSQYFGIYTHLKTQKVEFDIKTISQLFIINICRLHQCFQRFFSRIDIDWLKLIFFNHF